MIPQPVHMFLAAMSMYFHLVYGLTLQEAGVDTVGFHSFEPEYTTWPLRKVLKTSYLLECMFESSGFAGMRCVCHLHEYVSKSEEGPLMSVWYGHIEIHSASGKKPVVLALMEFDSARSDDPWPQITFMDLTKKLKRAHPNPSEIRVLWPRLRGLFPNVQVVDSISPRPFQAQR